MNTKHYLHLPNVLTYAYNPMRETPPTLEQVGEGIRKIEASNRAFKKAYKQRGKHNATR